MSMASWSASPAYCSGVTITRYILQFDAAVGMTAHFRRTSCAHDRSREYMDASAGWESKSYAIKIGARHSGVLNILLQSYPAYAEPWLLLPAWDCCCGVAGTFVWLLLCQLTIAQLILRWWWWSLRPHRRCWWCWHAIRHPCCTAAVHVAEFVCTMAVVRTVCCCWLGGGPMTARSSSRRSSRQQSRHAVTVRSEDLSWLSCTHLS
jgi:hypothetical protein